MIDLPVGDGKMRGCILGSIVERLYAPGLRIKFGFTPGKVPHEQTLSRPLGVEVVYPKVAVAGRRGWVEGVRCHLEGNLVPSEMLVVMGYTAH